MTQRAVGAKPCGMHVIVLVTLDALLGRIVERARRVAILANDLRMAAEQRKDREIVIEAHVLGPRELGMARPAVVPELRLVRIVLEMAADTLGLGQADRDGLEMTGHAFEGRVRAVEREFGVARMIEAYVEPFRRPMTGRAFGAVDAVVRVVVSMARHALGVERLLEFVAGMTRFAHQARVAAREREARPCKVVEQRLGPIRRRVAIAALGSVRAQVRVVIAVAVDALIGGLHVHLALVAAHAREVRMCARKRIAALELVIVVRVAPSGFGMAVGARFAEISHVLVVVAMAGDAFRGGVVKQRVDGMTVLAQSLCVAIAEWKIREPVIERRSVEPDDVGVAPLVVGVTSRARAVTGLDGQTVEARARPQILGDLRMAIETQVPLLLALEADMTGGALALVLGVARNDGARHYEPLEALQLCACVHANNRRPQNHGGMEDPGVSLPSAHEANVPNTYALRARG